MQPLGLIVSHEPNANSLSFSDGDHQQNEACETVPQKEAAVRDTKVSAARRLHGFSGSLSIYRTEITGHHTIPRQRLLWKPPRILVGKHSKEDIDTRTNWNSHLHSVPLTHSNYGYYDYIDESARTGIEFSTDFERLGLTRTGGFGIDTFSESGSIV